MGDKATYLGMEIDKVIDSDFEGLISDSNNCAGKINQIEIPHGRTNRWTDALTEAERAISRSELGKLRRIARIARQGAIYDASATAQPFTEGEFADLLVGKEEFSKIGDCGNVQKEIRSGFEHAWFPWFFEEKPIECE